jgi:hypothetical protein
MSLYSRVSVLIFRPVKKYCEGNPESNIFYLVTELFEASWSLFFKCSLKVWKLYCKWYCRYRNFPTARASFLAIFKFSCISISIVLGELCKSKVNIGSRTLISRHTLPSYTYNIEGYNNKGIMRRDAQLDLRVHWVHYICTFYVKWTCRVATVNC